MKITRIKEEKKNKFSKKDSFFINLFYLAVFYRYIILSIIGLAISVFVILLILDVIVPREMKSLDKKATLALFNELQSSGRHQDAILLMDYKGKEFIKDAADEIVYGQRLVDSYIYLGDYSTAEAKLLELWRNMPKYLNEVTDEDRKAYPEIDIFLKYAFSRIIYQFYEETGDTANQYKYYHIYRDYYNKYPSKIDSIAVKIYNERTYDKKMTISSNRLTIEYDDIVVTSFSNKEKARKMMDSYLNKIVTQNDMTPSYIIKCLNKQIRWNLDAGFMPEAYRNIHLAVEYVNKMHKNEEFFRLGELSDLCYEVKDYEMSKALCNRYTRYLESKGNTNSFEYLENYERVFRTLDPEKDWDEIVKNLFTYCEGMKRQIQINMPSMTEEQRESYARKFDFAYDLCIRYLQFKPSTELANLCFDNITFKTGLLLRSNISITNTINNSNDSEVKKMYDELLKLRQDLICQSVSDRLFSGKKTLEKKISQLEKEIALKSTDFDHKNQLPDNSSSVIQDHLEKSESVVDLVEHDGSLFALVLNSSKDVQYVPIGQVSDIKEKLKLEPADLYNDTVFSNYIWKPIEKAIGKSSVVYYLPIGIFNQISLGAMCLDKKTRTYLCEAKSLRLLSNPTDLIEERNENIISNSKLISLWGGIDYGNGVTNSAKPHTKRTAIKRGETLSNLIYAYQEVNDIASMLSNNNWKNILYTKTEATEKAFKNRAGKRDYIIHVSTHGFFNDKANQNNSMFESGLFFAGANKYWSNDTLKLELGQEDGILRAAEIATLDFTGCELVVLSACETGLGYSDTSEGVYGLQRSFKLAGAKYVLMSLWDVDDRATTLLMTEFYKNILSGKSLEDALENSKKAVKMAYPSPEDWGAFVLLH